MASLLVLLVDDDELGLEIAGLQLAAIGHAVLKATSGAQALEVLSQAAQSSSHVPDAVLTDMQMPDMNGAMLCKSIRKLGTSMPRVFAMSATRLKADALVDFDGFILKPLDLDSLRQILKPLPGAQEAQQKAVPNNQAKTLAKFPPASVVQMPEPALDAVILQKLRVLMPPEALDELLQTYLIDTRVRLSQMERFADVGDAQALRSCAHMIKGSASMAGATRIARIASLLETGEIQPERQTVLFNELRCACDAIEGTLAREDRLRDNRIKEAHDHQVPRIG